VNKHYICITGIALFFFVQSTFVRASQKQELEPQDTNNRTDGLKIMTAVSERDRGKDYVISASWILTKKGRVTNRMKYNEKRKNYSGQSDLIYKSILRYTFPPNIGRRAFVVWNFKDRQKTFWYHADDMPVAERTTHVAFLRPPAESDFSIMDYVDVNPEEEAHRVLKSEKYEDTICYVVESSPLKKHITYEKRVSWIDQDNLIPLKIDYFDRSGTLWKALSITWQNKAGLWFWKKAEVENVQNEYKTFIIIENVQVNVGLHDREFTKVALERKKF
jgi:outer membrane lipoprotein-sorting protein